MVDKAAKYASGKTNMNISVGHISLSFPINIIMTDVEASSAKRDTLLDVDRLQLNVQLLPLFRKKVEVDGISLKGVTVNSNDLIHGMILKGVLGELFLSSHGVDLDPETAIVNKVLIKDTHISLCINDTTSSDTTSSTPTYWKVFLKEADMKNVSFDYKCPQQNIHFSTALKNASLRNGYMDLHKSAYSLQTMFLDNGAFSYSTFYKNANDTTSVAYKTFDPSNISITDIGIQLDSVFYSGKDIKAQLRSLTLKEKQSGLKVVSAKLNMVSNSKDIKITQFLLNTEDSYVDMKGSMDWSVFDKKSPGLLTARIMSDIGKPDVMRFIGKIDEDFIKKYPSAPMRIRAGVDGNMNDLKLTSFHALLPEAFDILMKGEIRDANDNKRRNGSITLNAKSENTDFLASITGGAIIPSATTLDGKFSVFGTLLKTDMLLKEAESRIEAKDSMSTGEEIKDSLPNINKFNMQRALRLIGQYNWGDDSYKANLVANKLDLHKFLPNDSLFTLTSDLEIEGKGFDFFSSKTTLGVKGYIKTFHYGSYNLSGFTVDATFDKNNISSTVDINNADINLSAILNGIIKKKDITASLDADIKKIDWQGLHLADDRLQTSQTISVKFATNLDKQMKVDASMINTSVIVPKRTFRTKDLFLGFATDIDSTHTYLKSGDLDFSLSCKDHINKLSKQIEILMGKIDKQWQDKHIDQEALRKYLPGACLKIIAGKDNPLCNYLAMQGIGFDKLFIDMDASPDEGLNGEGHIYGFHTDSLTMDTIYIDVQQDLEGIKILSGINSKAHKNQEAFDLSLEGSITTNQAQILVEYLNAKKQQGVYMGLMADLYKHGIKLHFFPEYPTIVYRPFNLNKDNYIFLGDKGRVYGNVQLRDTNGSGISFYTNNEDSTALQDMNLELANLDLKEFRRILPYMPNMNGSLNGETHFIKTTSHTTVSTDLRIDKFVYEGTPLGNWEFNGVYLPGENNEHHIDGLLAKDGTEIAKLSGLYFSDDKGKGGVKADVDFEHFPLDVLNPFMPDRSLEFNGDIDGTLAMNGTPEKPIFNGNLTLDSVTMFMPELSALFRFDKRPVKMVDSKMEFDQFKIFTKGKNPFIVDGNVDFANLDKMKVNLKMHASNYELLNAPKNKRSIVYGKMYVDFDATLRGPIEEMVMRGNMNILGKTNFTYVMKDSPLSVNDRLNDMVTFVNFSDTVDVNDEVIKPVSINGIDIAMTFQIDQAVQARVDLTADGSNYMILEGGGDLAFQYTPQGNMLLNGRYSLISGEMKYQIPVIPLKTFNIQNGSYLEWTGNVMNPTVSITATESMRASVGENGQASRMVPFNVGVTISRQLQNPELAFILSSPEDASVQEQLNGMSAEERGKLAVTMLVTGVYMAEGNSTGGFNVNNTLNSFLQSEISNIVGKTMDINVGMESVDDGEGGSKRTDYNFQFAKRFWNNRFRIVIGGKVSTGNTAQQDESFIDNISIEYRLDNSGTRYVKVFYDKNYDSILEGEITETGVGVVLRRKMTNLGELFIFKRRKNND